MSPVCINRRAEQSASGWLLAWSVPVVIELSVVVVVVVVVDAIGR